MSSEIPSNPRRVIPDKSLQPIQSSEEGPKDTVAPFSTYMNQQGTNPLLESGTTPQITPFDLAHGKVPAPGPTLQTVQEQTKVAHGLLADVGNQLNTPKLKLKQSTKYLLKNKLTAARTNIQSASQKAGAQIVEDEQMPAGAGPLQKFLNLVTSGQNQLKETQQHLASIASSGQDIRPADMLQIQVKLSKAQQQIEYSSLLLGKAVDDLKMMMNIQL